MTFTTRDAACWALLGILVVTPLTAQALHRAASTGNLGMARTLVNAGIDVNGLDADGATPLHYAARRSRLPIMTLLLSRGADVNVGLRTNGNSPLHEASLNGRLDAVELLLPHGADLNQVNDQGSTALHLAVDAGYGSIVGALVDEVRRSP